MNKAQRTPSSAGLCAGSSQTLAPRSRPAAPRAPRQTSTGFIVSVQPANPLSILQQPTNADGRINRDVRHRPLGPVDPVRVKTQSFEDDLLLLRQDSSSFEYWGGRGFRRA